MELDYTVKRSPTRKRLSITVERDRTVVVHAPRSASDEAIRRAVDSRRQWIYEKIGHDQKYAQAPHPPGKELVNGESALYLGRSHRIELVGKGSDEIRFDQQFQIPTSLAKHGKEVLRDWYVARAKEFIVPRARRHAESLGVEFSKILIVGSRYRWGSCTPKSNITLNWRLIKAPVFVIDYVITHELAHLLEPNHTPQFWSIVRAHSPKMEKAKQWLLEHGQLLEEEI